MPADIAARAVVLPVPVERELPAALLTRAAGYAAAARATSTKAAYATDWRHFCDWCDVNRRRSLPAAPETVAAYLSAFAGVLATSTLGRRRTVIRLAHRAAELEPPTDVAAVREVWAGIRRGHHTAAAAKTALWTADMARLLAPLPAFDDPTDPGVLIGLRDRALLLLGYAAALRRSELAALDVDDVVDNPHGLVVRIRSSKTDQDGTGAEVGIPHAQQSGMCPVTAVRTWRAVLATRLGVAEDHLTGALFRPIDRHGHLGAPRAASGASARLTPAAVRLIVRRRCTAAGLSMADYAAHSLRSGFATQASANGAAERDVMRHGRWKSVTVARGYIRRGNLFTDNAAGRLGL